MGGLALGALAVANAAGSNIVVPLVMATLPSHTQCSLAPCAFIAGCILRELFF